MEKVNQIIQHPTWMNAMQGLEYLEKDRKYCNHNLDHLLSVARIAYIENLEKDLKLSKEVIYATALLHDIGRYHEYTQGIPHEVASANLALEILKESTFSSLEQQAILDAIKHHRQEISQNDTLIDIIIQADKKSRNCFMCKASDTCKWHEDKKNKTIER